MACRYTPHAVALALLLAGGSAAQAQLSDAIKGAIGGGSSGGGALGGLGGAAMPSLGDVGIGNITGVVEYCAKNQYLGGGSVGKVKDGLMGKLGGEQKAEATPGYQEGLSGVLGGNSDKKVDLGKPGIKEQLTDKVCAQVLDYGKSLL